MRKSAVAAFICLAMGVAALSSSLPSTSVRTNLSKRSQPPHRQTGSNGHRVNEPPHVPLWLVGSSRVNYPPEYHGEFRSTTDPLRWETRDSWGDIQSSFPVPPGWSPPGPGILVPLNWSPPEVGPPIGNPPHTSANDERYTPPNTPLPTEPERNANHAINRGESAQWRTLPGRVFAKALKQGRHPTYEDGRRG
ncbi:hypothetical protein F5148DRAFT_1220190 [Russula earlei]|uniref:Uncharacterized protein n=1 Tax=Russula earlei TaxID=71964 RepID=A0ACC0U227_9AGAM|nr:hypothetical protein F5148DRAFT_1220190 [Russula earlei]